MVSPSAVTDRLLAGCDGCDMVLSGAPFDAVGTPARALRHKGSVTARDCRGCLSLSLTSDERPHDRQLARHTANRIRETGETFFDAKNPFDDLDVQELVPLVRLDRVAHSRARVCVYVHVCECSAMWKDSAATLGQVKQTPLLDYAEGTALFIRARNKTRLEGKSVVCFTHEKNVHRERPLMEPLYVVCWRYYSCDLCVSETRLGKLAAGRFEKVLAASSNHAATLATYGFLCEDVFRDYATADALYRRAVTANPRHVRMRSSACSLLLCCFCFCLLCVALLCVSFGWGLRRGSLPSLFVVLWTNRFEAPTTEHCSVGAGTMIQLSQSQCSRRR